MNILILGVGSAQVDAINYCKASGYNVHGISYLEEGPGLELVDKFSKINITDKQKVLEYAKENKIDLLYSVGSDIAMPTVAYVSEKLNLPKFVDEKTTELLNNKGSLRKFFQYKNFPNIKHKVVSSIEELNDWKIYPSIIKPVDNQGQRGVFKISNRKDLIEFFDKSLSFSRSNQIIIEEYINGFEISVNAFVYKRRIIYSFISDRLVIEYGKFNVIKGHYLPSKIDFIVRKKVKDLVSSAIKKIGIENGPVYFQIKYTPNDDVYIIEIASRLDGCHLWQLINYKYKINLLKLSFDLLIKNSIKINPPNLDLNNDLILNFYLSPTNSVFSNGSAITDELLFNNYYYKPGETVKSINGYLEKTGYKISKVGNIKNFKKAV